MSDTYWRNPPPGRRVSSAELGDFVAIDDSNDFTYYETEQHLLRAFEYVSEAVCILDRKGTTYRLTLDANRHLMLAPPDGPVEFSWLRQAWLDAQNSHRATHRLRRFFPLTVAELLADLFEIVPLEQETPAAAWTLDLNGQTFSSSRLSDIDHQLAHEKVLDRIRVTDPFGHLYKPARHHSRWHVPGTREPVVYIEIPSPATSPSSPPPKSSRT